MLNYLQTLKKVNMDTKNTLKFSDDRKSAEVVFANGKDTPAT